MIDESIIGEYCIIIKNKISQARFDSALGSIEKLLYNFPNNENGYYFRAVCEFAQEKYDESIMHYKTAIEINPGFAKAYFNLGVSYYILSKYDDALINIAKALIIFTKQKELDKKERCIEALKLIEAQRKLK